MGRPTTFIVNPVFASNPDIAGCGEPEVEPPQGSRRHIEENPELEWKKSARFPQSLPPVHQEKGRVGVKLSENRLR